jgi:phosphoglycerate dehydrogenase-like enzyme
MKIAVIDDWQNNARNFADWSRVELSHQLDFYSDHLSGAALIERLAPYDILCVMRERTVFSEDVIAQLPALKAVITSGMRNAGLDLAAFSARNIPVSGTESPGHATSELAMIFIGMLARQTVANANSMSGTGWQVATGRDLRGATLGILGLGRLGRQLADLAKAFGMNVQAWSQNLTAETCAEQGVTYADKEQFFATSDFISLHLKLSPRVTGIVGAAELSLMKPDSYLVNTSRGPLIDVPALCDALRAGQIAGAAIDVFDVEPLPADDVMRKTPNLLMTPHIGYVTNETMSIFYGQTCESLEAYLAGSPIRLLSA